MNIFLTGSSGFIGRNIIKNSSLYKEIKIFANSRKKISTKNNIKIINKNLNKISYLDLQKIDVIIHSASVGVKNNDIQIKKSIKFNFYESLLFFKKAIKAGCKNWIILGSSSEYGNSLLKKRKINKNTELVPADNYSLSKCLLFYSLSSIAKVYDINLVYLRIFPTYGLNEKSHRLIPQMKKSRQNRDSESPLDHWAKNPEGLRTCGMTIFFGLTEVGAEALKRRGSKRERERGKVPTPQT